MRNSMPTHETSKGCYFHNAKFGVKSNCATLSSTNQTRNKTHNPSPRSKTLEQPKSIHLSILGSVERLGILSNNALKLPNFQALSSPY